MVLALVASKASEGFYKVLKYNVLKTCTTFNTSSASIPITICSNYEGKKIPGYSLLCGFGVGLSISAVVVSLRKTKIYKIIKL